MITEARCNDVKLADAFPLNPGSIVAMDRCYNDYALFAMKQNSKVKSFVGTSENALRIQIWKALIAPLLLDSQQLTLGLT